jgi:hypothetical protein
VEGRIADAAREDLAARLGMEMASVAVHSIGRQDWPDACLGLAPEGQEACVKETVPGYRAVLNAAGHGHEYRTGPDGQGLRYSGPAGIAAPDACMPPGTAPIYSPEDGYCFAYPVRFHRTDERGPINIYGPAHGPGPEPLYAWLAVEISALQPGQTLASSVEAFLAQFNGLPLPERRETVEIGGEPAELLEVVPGMLGSRDLFFVHGGKLFHLVFWPAPAVTSETAADVEELYETVRQNFHFSD